MVKQTYANILENVSIEVKTTLAASQPASGLGCLVTSRIGLFLACIA